MGPCVSDQSHIRDYYRKKDLKAFKHLIMYNSSNRKDLEVYQPATAFKSFAQYEESNLGIRHQMEDQSFVIDCFLDNCPKSALFGIFDGHGGCEVSKFLVKFLPKMIKDCYIKSKKKGKSFFEEAFENADKEIDLMDAEAGSTATVCLLTLEQSKRVLYIANVGDSNCYIFDDNDHQRLNQEHRCDNKLEMTRIKQAGGKILMGRLGGLLAVTRAFGDFSLKKGGMGLIVRPDVKKIEIRLNHRYVFVASDGIWDFVDVKKVQKLVKEQYQPDDLAKRIIKMAIQGGSADNISIVIVKL